MAAAAKHVLPVNLPIAVPPDCFLASSGVRHGQAARTACSLSYRVRGYGLSIGPNPLTPPLSPAGRGSPAVPVVRPCSTAGTVSIKLAVAAAHRGAAP